MKRENDRLGINSDNDEKGLAVKVSNMHHIRPKQSSVMSSGRPAAMYQTPMELNGTENYLSGVPMEDTDRTDINTTELSVL
ncbi:hypothetical protein CHS0354_042713 [Potamilus streckersoni]|uniref:Uncharacterized protein n=1 Tax=Potamilus streckersoni TaxID=2493646 RepID=A0AAE0S9I5_9BIVA|nr:hypothetical protein CHS0354_042713 [Potamilus streckersoni]